MSEEAQVTAETEVEELLSRLRELALDPGVRTRLHPIEVMMLDEVVAPGWRATCKGCKLWLKQLMQKCLPLT